MRSLADHGLVVVGTVGLDRPNRVVLTAKGAERVPRVKGEEVVLRTRISPQSGAANHLIATAEIWCGVLDLGRQFPGISLKRYFSEGELRRSTHAGQNAVIPDAISVISIHEVDVAFAWEVDCATENPAFLGRKLNDRYPQILTAGGWFVGIPTLAVIVVAPTVTRLRAIARFVRDPYAISHTYFQLGSRATTIIDATDPHRTTQPSSDGTHILQVATHADILDDEPRFQSSLMPTGIE
jgi:hypothetical protein